MGPIEAIAEGEAGGFDVSVVGQVFSTAALDVTVGDYVVAAGSGRQLEVLVPVVGMYVPGSSPIAVRGQIVNVSADTGMMAIGDLSLDYTSILSADSNFLPQAGDVLEFSGTQPAFGGVALLSSLVGIHGGALQGIHGGALQGIHGGALQGIHGGALQGIHGGALQGIHGGALQ